MKKQTKKIPEFKVPARTVVHIQGFPFYLKKATTIQGENVHLIKSSFDIPLNPR